MSRRANKEKVEMWKMNVEKCKEIYEKQIKSDVQ